MANPDNIPLYILHTVEVANIQLRCEQIARVNTIMNFFVCAILLVSGPRMSAE